LDSCLPFVAISSVFMFLLLALTPPER